jgi:hypothetical protein
MCSKASFGAKNVKGVKELQNICLKTPLARPFGKFNPVTSEGTIFRIHKRQKNIAVQYLAYFV